MNGDPTDYVEFHDEWRAVARQRLAGRHEHGTPLELPWTDVVAAGWNGLEVPVDLGGAGATFAEVALVLEELGRTATPSAYLGATVLAAGVLLLVEPAPERDQLLADVAAGRLRVAVALPVGDEEPTDVAFTLVSADGGPRLSGFAPFVLDAPGADRLLVLARADDDSIVVVDVDPAGVTVTDRPVVDGTRRFGSVQADSATLTPSSVLRFAGDGTEACARLRDRGALAVACDSLGVAVAMLEATVAYATARHQFGRPIGSFQAVQHACADMHVQVAVGRELVDLAVAAFGRADPEAWVAAAMAKSRVGAAAVEVAGKAMQLHGGIGYTWESGVHAFLKRAALNRSLFGSPGSHRRRLGQRYLTTTTGASAP
jgi:alkylation response protein AidB-like acyl-CoA dehydrogenase